MVPLGIDENHQIDPNVQPIPLNQILTQKMALVTLSWTDNNMKANSLQSGGCCRLMEETPYLLCDKPEYRRSIERSRRSLSLVMALQYICSNTLILSWRMQTK